MLVVLEGADGVGKSTMASRLASDPEFAEHKPLLVRSLGTTPVGDFIRSELASDLFGMLTADTQASLFVAGHLALARAVLSVQRQNRLVIVDRYVLSTLVYQNVTVPVNVIDRVAGGPPELTLILCAPWACVESRWVESGKGQDYFERIGKVEHTRRNAKYADAWRDGVLAGRVRLVDASGDADAVYNRILEWVRYVYAKQDGRTGGVE